MKKLFPLFLLVIGLFVISSTNDIAFASESDKDDSENYKLITENLTTLNQEVDLIVNPLAVDNENYYPGTKTFLKPGDVIYSSKTFLSSTKIVGHVAIVGPDYYIYHVNPSGSVAGKRDTLTQYRGRHDTGEKLKVYRPSSGGEKAATWAKNNYGSAINYKLSNLSVKVIKDNYCSKFLWQAFYYGSGYDVSGSGYTDSFTGWVLPSMFTTTSKLFYLTSFNS